MSLALVYLAAKIEKSDDFHIARLLILLNEAGGRNDKPVQGIMKIAKMDFLLRYPNCLIRALKALGKEEAAESISEEERNTIETRMIRYRFGPWDWRYRRWISLMIAKGLAITYMEGKTVNLKLTESGKKTAEILANLEEFQPISIRSNLIATKVGGFTATKIKDFIYEVFPEIVNMSLGKEIRL